MKWNDSSKIYPKQTCDLQDEIFCISDGENIGLGIWVNLCSENPDCGADQDEYDFKIIGKFFEPKYWVGPISKSIFYSLIYSKTLDLPNKKLNQPERLSPEGHIVEDNEMISDSLN